MSAATWIVGGILGGVVLGALAKKKKKRSRVLCGVSEAGAWAVERGYEALMITSRSVLPRALPQSRGGDLPDDFDTATTFIILQDSCTVLSWTGDKASGDWTENPQLTEDLRGFKLTPRTRPPGAPPPTGARPPPGT